MTSSPEPQPAERHPAAYVANEAPPPAGERGAGRGGSRLLGVAATLLQVHVQIARQELARDEGRIIGGVVMMMIGALLVATVIVLLQVLGIAIMQAHGLGFAWAVLAMGGVDAGLGTLLLVLGRRALRQPLMAETRALLRRTVRSFTSP